jgi:hypothetical protein
MTVLKRPYSLKSLWLSVILFATVWPSAAYGASRYVDNSGSPACSNSASFGSETQPWCTISYGVSNINGGDDLYVKRGTYNEEPYINGPAGSASKSTVVRTYPGHIVTIRGAGNTGRVKIVGTSYFTFDGFIITNFNQGLWLEGVNHVTIQNCTVHDVGQEAINVGLSSSFVTVQDCTVYNTQVIGGCCNGEGVYVGRGSTDPHDNTNNVIVRNNTIHNVTDEAIELKPGTHDCIVDGNTIYNAADLGTTVGAIEVNQAILGPNQSWGSNPNHIVRNNLIHDSTTGIHAGTGVTVYNNVIYNTMANHFGIYVDNAVSDSYARLIYHNTIAMASSNAVKLVAGTTNVRNNIGPTTTNNLAYNAAYFVNATAHDFHLVAGSAPIDVGLDLTAVVPVDKDGNSRTGSSPDDGAYEFGSANKLTAPTNLRIIR